MTIEIITPEDLEVFRRQLLLDIGRMFRPPLQASEKPWLKSREVEKLLRMSANTLRKLRTAGKLHPAKVGGLYYYSMDDLRKMLDYTGR